MLDLIRPVSFLDQDTFLNLYEALVRFHVEYANMVIPCGVPLEVVYNHCVQSYATKLINDCKHMSYDERLEYLKSQSLNAKWISGEM